MDDQQGSAWVRRSIPLIIGTVVNGLAAYVFIKVGTGAVGAEAFAPVSVVWVLWSVSVAVLTFPIQNWVIRTARADSGEQQLAAARRSLLVVGLVAGLLTFAVTGFAHDRVFSGGGLAFALLAGLVPPGAVAMGVSRGLLVARGRMTAAGINLAAENLVRVAGAVVIASAGADAVWLAAALVAGFGVVLFWPDALRPRSALTVDARSDVVDVEAVAGSSALAFLAGLSAGSVLAQVVLTSGPVFLAVVGASAEDVTLLFGALALFRAPYLIALGGSMEVTAELTGLVVGGQHAALAKVRRLIVGLSAAGACAAALFGWAAGQGLVQWLVAADAPMSRAALACVAAGSTLALGTLAQSLVLIARADPRRMAVSWSVATASFVVVAVVPTDDPTLRVSAALVLAQVVALTMMVAKRHLPGATT